MLRKPVARIETTADTGLTQAQVKERMEKGWSNAPVDSPSKTTKEIIISNVFTYFNLIFLVIAVLLLLVGAFRDLTFLPVIICNTLIGIIQEIRSKKVLDKLSVLNAPKATVVREGKLQTIPAEKAVLDDVVKFQAGNQICADATVIDGEVQVNESLLTGESDEITKKPGDTLMSGSFVVSGSCFGRLEQVGADSYISKLTLEAKATKEGEQSEMIRSLDKLVQIVGFLIIPIGIVLFGQQYLLGDSSIKTSMQAMVAAIIGMIPEGLYLLASVALVVSVMRLATKKVLVHDMKCIETLARVNVLCVDKTGTITENTMKVHDVVSLEPYEKEELPPLKELLGDFAHAMSKDNITMAAMQEYFTQGSGQVATSVTSFSSAFKYSSVTFHTTSYVLGAPEFVLRDDYEIYKETIESYGSEGYRVLVFGRYEGTPDGKALTEAVVPYGLVLLANPIRKEAWETFQYFADQGVDIKVISGDNPVTVSKVASQAGIANADNYIDASQLKTPDDIKRAVLKYTVFGRVTPDQKRQFVRALKEAGKTVAMTGDGVNDVLALKDADCSIAMASGSDAAAQASQLVLLESNFSCMPSVVLEGRRVVNNIERSASLFLVKNIFSFLLSLFSMAFMITYPLEPSQISMVAMFTIGIPAFLLAMEPNKKMIEGHFLTNVLLKALPAGLTDVLIVGFLTVFGQTFGMSNEEISTAATLLLAIVGLMILFKISKPMNVFRWIVWSAMVAGLLFCVIFLKNLFGIGVMTRKCCMTLIVFAVATEPLLRYISQIVAGIRKRMLRRREKRLDKKYPRKRGE
ncbi:cation-translocating P-type ATPase [Oliverpabstia sp. DFI.9.49]|nr:cation-translocating P-type ATPase [Blautia sp. DFI.9.9]MCG5645299.1 cation-translocating P-type ATPase [Oliverpabstia sp. DFI.9.49]